MAKRKRRNEEELIADLEAEIRRIKQKVAEAEAKARPDGKAFLAAARALDKAIDVVEDPDLLGALEAARTPLSEQMIKQGLRMPDRANSRSVITPPGPAARNGTKKRIRRTADDLERLSKQVHIYVKKNPGQRLGEIAKALHVETKDARRPTFDLVDAGYAF